MAEVKTFLIWSDPASEAAYRALVELRAQAAAKMLDGPPLKHGISADPAISEIEKVMTRLLIEHLRPGEIGEGAVR